MKIYSILLMVTASFISSQIYAAGYSNSSANEFLNRAKDNAVSRLDIALDGSKGFQSLSMKNHDMWKLLIDRPTEEEYLAADNDTYRLFLNTSASNTALLLRQSISPSLKGYAVEQ
ncbi:hypothetical protein [Marinomonas sp. 2405UD68-3]|uniref:hypothetical protein n=1 Tax=Marinomonas sp. 2405UD68-3 TaxID=3391835 RepID=UPI0039C9DB86